MDRQGIRLNSVVSRRVSLVAAVSTSLVQCFHLHVAVFKTSAVSFAAPFRARATQVILGEGVTLATQLSLGCPSYSRSRHPEGYIFKELPIIIQFRARRVKDYLDYFRK